MTEEICPRRQQFDAIIVELFMLFVLSLVINNMLLLCFYPAFVLQQLTICCYSFSYS